MLKSNNTTLKTKLEVLNSIQLSDDKELEAKGKGKHFVSRFIEPGIAEYKDTFGKVLITKETLDKFINTMVGVPIIIKHKDITSENVDKERVGVVSEVWYNPEDGWYYCSGILFDSQAIDLVKNQGWSVSCTYDFETDNKKGTYHGLDYDMQFTDGEFLHLALVPNPRYERANIVVNSKDEEQTAEKTSEVQNSFDTVLNAISEVFVECLGELRNSFPNHEGRPGKVGGSLPRGESLTSSVKTFSTLVNKSDEILAKNKTIKEIRANIDKSILEQSATIGNLNKDMMNLLKTEDNKVNLSLDTLLKNRLNHSEIDIKEYEKINELLAKPDKVSYSRKNNLSILVFNYKNKNYLMVIKTTQNKKENYLTSFRLFSDDEFNKY